jgi:hypothetical protein
MYKYRNIKRNSIGSVEKLEGETLEQKLARVVHNGEAITDGAPLIYTERADGIVSAYNIKTDRWEIACDSMDLVSKNILAKRENKPGKKPEDDTKVVNMKGKEVGGPESIDGTSN